ncbi:MAG: hypothetical protein ACXVNO_00125 [Bacteroidia bacterium]
MVITLFGGVGGRPVSDYLKNWERNVGAAARALKAQGLAMVDIHKQLPEKYALQLVNIDYEKREITLISKRLGKQPVEGIVREVEIGTFQMKIPYTGEREVLECTPVDEQGNRIFYGTRGIIVRVSEGFVITEFEARVNYKPQIDNFAADSLGRWYENQQKINETIKKWNSELENFSV